MLVVLGVFAGRMLVTFWCPEAIHNEKGEHVTFDDSCTFSHDFQGPQGTENYTLCEMYILRNVGVTGHVVFRTTFWVTK